MNAKMDKNPRLSGKKPLVIHVVTSLDFGGVERRMEILGSVLGHSQLRHQFCAIGDGGATSQKLRAMNLEVACLEQPVKIPSWGALYALLKLFRQQRPLVVHAHGAEANFHGLFAAWLTRVPVRIGEEIGIPSHSKFAQLVFRLVYLTAHKVIGMSRVVTDCLIDLNEIPSYKAIRVYNPVQFSSSKLNATAPDDVFRIVFVGRLESVKNPLSLLNAFEQFSSIVDSCELWYVGEGSERGELERRVVQKGLNGKVRLFGYQQNPEEYISKCNILVQPSISEGFSLALVEALGCGVPVLSSAVGAAEEVIVHGKTGWLLDSPSSDSILSALKKVRTLTTDQLREMGQLARKSVKGRFEPIQYLEKLESLYQDLAGEESRDN